MSAIHQLLTDHIDIWTAADTEKKSGRGRSSGNAANVYGIRKLRELIYELAATGRIVDHKNDAKQYLLGEVSEFIMGQAPPGNECNTNGDGVIFVKTGEFGSLFPEVKEWTTKPLKLAKNGDVLICVVGATIGKLNLAIDCAIGRSVAAIRPAQVIETKYLYFVLIPFTLRLRERSRGSAQGVIGKAELSSVKIRVPSINEQRQIVAKVDELMALCDQLETQHSNAAEAHEKLVSHLLGTLTQSPNIVSPLCKRGAGGDLDWQRIAAHFDTLFTTEASIDALKQTLRQLAVMGKLVPQDPNGEPASELLKRIQTEKAKLIAEGKIKKDKPLLPITEEEKPFDLPEGWEWTLLGQLVIKVSDGPHFSPKYVNKDEGVPFISARNIKVDGWELDSAKYVSHSDHKEFTKRTKAEVGDILYTKGGTTGVAIVNDLDFEFSVWVHVAVLNIFQGGIFNHYFSMALNSPHCYAQSQKFTHGISNKDLGLTRMVHISVPLPPLSEQYRIVAKVDELMAMCDQLKSRITEANQLQQKLADVVVEQATNQIALCHLAQDG